MNGRRAIRTQALRDTLDEVKAGNLQSGRDMLRDIKSGSSAKGEPALSITESNLIAQIAMRVK